MVQKGMNRREFLTTLTGAAVAATLAPNVLAKSAQKTLRILQWSHFVPSYDKWFDKYAAEWGSSRGVEVTVDLIALADLGTRANAEVAAQQGLDSNMAARAILWSFDGSVQDRDENVVLKSDQALEALDFAVRLFKEGMNPSVLSWNAASNNQALNASQTAYILNSISAYRTA